MSLAARDKESGLEAAMILQSAGFSIAATTGTALYFEQHGIQVKMKVAKMAGDAAGEADIEPSGELSETGEVLPNVLDLISAGQVQLVVNTPRGRGPRADGMYIRNAATAAQIPCITTVAAAKALAKGIQEWLSTPLSVTSLQEMHQDGRIEGHLDGHLGGHLGGNRS